MTAPIISEYSLSEADNAFIIQQGSLPFSILNREGILLYTSPALEQLLAYSSGSLNTKSFFDLLYPTDTFQIQQEVKKAQTGYAASAQSIKLKLKAGKQCGYLCAFIKCHRLMRRALSPLLRA